MSDSVIRHSALVGFQTHTSCQSLWVVHVGAWVDVIIIGVLRIERHVPCRNGAHPEHMSCCHAPRYMGM